MPKMKTKRAAAKRFKPRASGSIKLDDFIAMIKQEDEARSPFAH